MFPFKTALNASTLFPFTRDVERQITIASEAGYQGIELWVEDIQTYLSQGGTTDLLCSKLDEARIELVNAIAFFPWADVNDEVRKMGMQQAKEEMQILAEVGCKAVAAPPIGSVEAVTLEQFANYFSELFELGDKLGVEPYLEFWGRAKKLSTLKEAQEVLSRSGIPNAKMLLDPFHMYTGGSPFEALGKLEGSRIGLFHVNDYPDIPTREMIGDDSRVFPGEGVAPTSRIAELLLASGYHGYLSLELFQSSYGSRSAAETASYGLHTIKQNYSN
ncbi:sugar phosphate isomerase/epimerase family protein [Paenibacillus sp. LHD-38]|uniref:sugar phosphate isomerase/epimerase family protein n=1 Tax=Paenibacillus sp. LHD-38 TaxID=3072143 RepID=UPI00281035C7|nr:sugar phosphate isomerase/epimerase family protein [Paenibacillus sp. LHD-38]MDQ8738806.1 sugar phosphate isomerase/epimerase family protein [Paenibacillus sp. LHD-38]